MIAELERDSSIANLAEIVRLGLDELGPSEDDLGKGHLSNGDHRHWTNVLDQVSGATLAIYREFPIAISWEELLLEGSSIEVSTRRVIVAHPVLDYSDILVARRPIGRVKAIAREFGLVENRGVSVRLTGNPALNYDEMIGIAWDVGGASAFCFLIVTFVLVRALRSLKLVIAALITLFSGLIWTMAFAAATVGSLNLLTISFAVIYLGLGVDFGLHLGMAYADGMRHGRGNATALKRAAGRVGSALVFCTLTTSIGFWVFVSSDFRGLAELGLIAGGSMFIIFFLTLTYFPALVSDGLAIDQYQLRAELRFGDGWWNRVGEHPRAVVAIAFMAFGGALLLLPGTRLNSNVITMRDPDTESVQAMLDLLEEPDNSPWYLNLLAPDLETAVVLANQVEEAESVDWTLTLADYVPNDQETKLEILSDMATQFEPLPPLDPGTRKSHGPSIKEQIQALRELRDYLDAPLPREERSLVAEDEVSEIRRSMLRLRDRLSEFLARIERDGEEIRALAELERVLLGGLPEQVDRLRRSLNAREITLENLPSRLVGRMLAEDGSARVQVFPAGDMLDMDDFRRFVADVTNFSPTATGMTRNQVEMGRATQVSFYRAMTAAVLSIALLLFLLWRSMSDVLLVMTSLFLGATLTGASMVALGITFDFTNVIVIPLLFGIGVDSAIHLIQQEKDNPSGGLDLLGSVTARAVFYSSLTTMVSFGTMSLAGHNGLRGLGILLSLGLFYTVTSVLFVLPALIKLRAEARDRRAKRKVPLLS